MSLTKRSAMFQRWLDEQRDVVKDLDYDYLEYCYFQQLEIERKARTTSNTSQDED